MSGAIGAMRDRVALQSPERVADEIGGAAIVWTHEGDAWAHIEALGAEERAAFDALGPSASFRLTIYRRPDIRADWRVLCGERVLSITGVVDDGAPRMTLLCAEELQ